MPGWLPVLAAYVCAGVFFTALGLPMARAVAPAGFPALGAAPALGWLVYTVLALPFLSIFGFGAVTAWLFTALCAAIAAWFWRRPAGVGMAAAALAMGLLPLMAIMPKNPGAGLLLAPPMFDHVKIAVVDAILREGLPVPNPFYGQGRGVFAYYYLWHFGVALWARLTGLGGWGAEAAITGFTAYASVMLMFSVARALGGGTVALAGTALLCLPGSLRPVLAFFAGDFGTNPFIPRKSDIGGWLNQAAWVPQHMASACCVVVSALLLLRLREGASWLAALALGLSVAAGFECSTWVGGIGFAIAGSVLGVSQLFALPPERRRVFLVQGAVSGMIAAVLIAPFVLAQLNMVAARQTGPAIAFAPYNTFGWLMPASLRPAMDVFGFWLVLLPFQFPALIPLAACAASRPAWLRPALLRAPPEARHIAAVFGVLGISCLGVSWLLRSTIENNDLGWRAVLPALLVMPGFAACLAERIMKHRPRLVGLCGLLALLGVPQSITMIGEYAAGVTPGAPRDFARTANLWPAIRRDSAPTDRIAVNPKLAQSAVFWPANIAWALFSDRSSCYAGEQSVIAYGNLSRAQLAEIDSRFSRVFEGSATSQDVALLASRDDCSLIAITPEDGAWAKDIFGGSTIFRLREATANWRIYVRARPPD
jgi:hypothetical protein